MNIDCEGAEDILASYALQALEEEEGAALEEHLEGCPTCRLALEQHQQVVQQLPRTVQLVDPPADLKGRLMARIDVLEPTEARRQGWTGSTIERPSRFLPRFSRSQVVMVSLGAVTLFLVAWSIVQTLEVNHLKRDNADLASDVDSQWEALTFATSPGVETVHLSGTGMSPASQGSLLVDHERNRALVMVRGLTPPAKGMVYQLWLWRTDGPPVNLGTFDPGRNGLAMWPFQSPVSLVTYRYWGVTMEPGGGSTSPTSPLIIGSDVASDDR